MLAVAAPNDKEVDDKAPDDNTNGNTDDTKW